MRLYYMDIYYPQLKVAVIVVIKGKKHLDFYLLVKRLIFYIIIFTEEEFTKLKNKDPIVFNKLYNESKTFVYNQIISKV